jgi:hypothetical protein
MKKIVLFLLPFLILASCGIKKEIAEQIAKGNYDRAINLSIKKLQKKRNHKKADAYVLLLEEAFAKAQKRDLKRIEQLKRDGNPENWKKIYELYNDLISRQERIEPLLPLRVVKENRNARFEFKDYMPGLLEARDKMVAYRYDKAKKLLRYNDKKHIREAYDILEDIDRVYPNYKDVRNLMEEAHNRGTSYVGVVIENKTDKILPKRLEESLLDFNSVNANNFWTVYEPVHQDASNFDYIVKLIFTDIQVSPEREQEKIIDRERQIQTGWQYVRDGNGNVVKDSLGNPVKQPVYETVRAVVHQYRQFKEALIKAEVKIFDNRTKKQVYGNPLQSHFVFENIYLNVKGDKRALDNELNQFINNVRVPFPSNEQMVYDAGMDLKQKFEDLLYNARFE